MLTVLMVTLSYQVVQLPTKALCWCVLTMPGAQCVMTIGDHKKHKWFVLQWTTQRRVMEIKIVII